MLHDCGYLLPPLRLSKAIAAAEASAEVTGALSQVDSPSVFDSTRDGRRSPGSGGRSRSGSSASGEGIEAALPSHLRSFPGFVHALRYGQAEEEGGAGARRPPRPAPTTVTAVWASSLAAQCLLQPGLHAGALEQAEAVLSACGPGLPHASLLLLAVSAHVHLECCMEGDGLSFTARSSLYLRMLRAPPVPQALVHAGVWSPRTAWEAASAVLAACLAALRVLGGGMGGGGPSTTPVVSPSAGRGDASSASAASPDDVHELMHSLALNPPPPGVRGRGGRRDSGTEAGGAPALPLAFAAEYAARVLRFLTQREFASHVMHFRPSVAFAPARPELALLPWAGSMMAGPPSRRGGARRESTTPAPLHVAAPPAQAASSSWWPSSMLAAAPAGPTPAAHTPATDAQTAASLRASYERVNTAAAVAAFVGGASGYPLVDAAVRCLRAVGWMPPVLLPLIVTVWTKHLGRPWVEGARWAASLDVTGDPALTAYRWQAAAGLAGGCEWVCPTDGPDALSGFWPVPGGCPPLESVGPGLPSTPLPELTLLARWHPASIPHPAVMASPTASEFGSAPDPAGLLVRALVCVGDGAGLVLSPVAASLLAALGAPSLCAALPDAYLVEPWTTPEPIAKAVGLHLGSGAGSYPRPISDLAGARECTLAAVLAAHTAALAARARAAASMSSFPSFTGLSSMFSTASAAAAAMHSAAAAASSPSRLGLTALSWKASSAFGPLSWGHAWPGSGAGEAAPRPPAHGGFATGTGGNLLAALEASLAAAVHAAHSSGSEASWGLAGGFPFIVEEDAAVMFAQAAMRAEDGWGEVVDDERKKMKAYMAERGGGGVRVCLANVALDASVEAAYAAISNLKRYGSWDLTWNRVTDLGRADVFNASTYLLADSPPPPYSFVITARDFVMNRHCLRLHGQGVGIVLWRNSAHSAQPQTMTYIRGETLGVIGFIVRPMVLPPPCGYATALDGSRATLPPALLAASRPVPPAADAPAPAPGSTAPPPYPGGNTHMVMVACADPKGSIPAYLINFVARRTPRMWVERLAKHCAGMKAGEV